MSAEDFGRQLGRTWKGLGPIGGSAALAAITIFFLVMCTRSSPPATISNTSKADTENISVQAGPPVVNDLSLPSPKWEYTSEIDDMSGKKISIAAINATEKLSFSRPYQNAGTPSLIVRKHPRHGTDVILVVEGAHFLCAGYNGCHVLVRFDDAEPLRVSAHDPASHSTEALLLSQEAALISKLKHAKRVRIEAMFYKDGTRVMSFETGNFTWPK